MVKGFQGDKKVLTKVTTSTKLSPEMKERIEKDAKEKGERLSGFIEQILIDYYEGINTNQEEIRRLEIRLQERDEQIKQQQKDYDNLSERYQETNKLFGQEQELHLMSQRHTQSLIEGNKLLIEEKEQFLAKEKDKNRWWKFWE